MAGLLARAAIGRATSEEATARPLEKPKGVPVSWTGRATKDGEGMIYTDPSSKGATFVKIQRGNPNSSNPGQRYDNVRWTRNGKSLDRNGNPVSRESRESHIPLDEFEFTWELFR